MLTLDGSQGEGGGQILRTSLALSLITGQAFCLKKIRAGRKKPGLLHQHLAGVKAAATVGNAQVIGAELGSREITFQPGEAQPGEYFFAVGTAGSAVLVLQTVLPPLWMAAGPSRVTAEGGTHNRMAPPFEFLERAFFPLVEQMGPRLTASLHRHGFFPAGGGRVTVEVQPTADWRPLRLERRGGLRSGEATALVSRLPRHIAQRELQSVQETLDWPAHAFKIQEVTDSPGPGNAVILTVESQHVVEVFTGFGERGVPAETVAGAAAAEAAEYLAADAPVGQHLADQLILPLALAGDGSFRTLTATPHTITNIEVVERFLPVTFTVEPDSEQTCRISVAARP
ncbi:MAG: RNA 3'-terminal phosphate cyclase [Pirellulales bacterium]